MGTRVILLVVALYIVVGVVVGMIHGVTGSFASVNSASGSAYSTAASTVVGRIFVPEEALTADNSDGSSVSTVVTPDTETAEADNTETVSGDDSAATTDLISGERHYYRFVTTTRIQRLHVRTGPSLTAEIIDRLDKGTTGYIITPGTDWSYLVTDDGRMGYCFNGYLELTEIDPSEYPDEYKTVEPPVPLS